MSEKLCLKWNDFQENVNTAFGNLREDKEFADVTLASEDGHQIEAHKVILAASSPFFQNLLKRNQHPHPLIYMRGVKSENLLAIVDFLYCGEASVFQEDLDSFLAIAEELELNELMGQTKENNQQAENRLADLSPIQMNPTPIYKKEKSSSNTRNLDAQSHSIAAVLNNERRIAIPNFVPGDLKELDEKVKSLMEKSQNLAPSGTEGSKAKICKVCGKEGAGIAIRDHIEANHLKGVSLPCNMCGKDFRSRMMLRMHRCICK